MWFWFLSIGFYGLWILWAQQNCNGMSVSLIKSNMAAKMVPFSSKCCRSNTVSHRIFIVVCNYRLIHVVCNYSEHLCERCFMVKVNKAAKIYFQMAIILLLLSYSTTVLWHVILWTMILVSKYRYFVSGNTLTQMNLVRPVYCGYNPIRPPKWQCFPSTWFNTVLHRIVILVFINA